MPKSAGYSFHGWENNHAYHQTANSQCVDNPTASGIVFAADLPSLYSQEHAQSWRVFYCPDVRRHCPMKYPKPSLPFSDQADLLFSRGLVAPAKSDVVEKLKAVSISA
jgi:hypothetical protein